MEGHQCDTSVLSPRLTGKQAGRTRQDVYSARGGPTVTRAPKEEWLPVLVHSLLPLLCREACADVLRRSGFIYLPHSRLFIAVYSLGDMLSDARLREAAAGSFVVPRARAPSWHTSWLDP